MEKPDWVLWGDARKVVTLEQCVCLALDAEPTEIFTPKQKPEAVRTKPPIDRPNDWAAPVVVGNVQPRTRQQQNEQLAFTHEALLSPEGVKKLAKLRLHFDEGQPLLQPMGPYRNDEKRVLLYDFVRWANAMSWDIPEPLRISPTPAPAIAEPVPVVVDVVALEAEETDKAEPVANWKMRIQAAATAHCLTLRKSGSSPTKHSIIDTMAQWCRDNNVKTDTKIYPCANYLRTHVLGGKHWDVPN